MKKIYLTIVLLTLTVSSCSKDDANNEASNPFISTSWTADDYIASILYGSGCTTTIEFLTETTCQKIDYVPRGIFAGTDIETGTYSFTGATVNWTIDGETRTATMAGSTLTSTVVINGNNVIYRKN